ncbi:MAG TPA: LLM class F420-dependent oxidoreductase [Acidimicrobiia bacterium]|nr:LLM class F420-dependent oxidoreductase [Acidimicrobiia bacterium]
MPGGAVLPFWLDRPPEEALEIAANASRLGYPEIWMGEMLHFDAFALAGAVAASTDRPTITVGPLAIDLRDPVAMAMGIASVAVLGRRPARLAVGASSPAVVQRWHGRPWTAQASKIEEGVRLIRSVLAGDRTSHAGAHFRSEGFRSALGERPAHITVAAFGPRMTEMAGRCADRVVLNLVSARQAAEAARSVPIPVAVWVVAGVDPTEGGLDQIRRQIALYLGAPGYASVLADAGLADLVEAARAGLGVSDLARRVKPRHLESVAALGTGPDVIAQLARYEEAGAEVMVVPVTAGDPGGLRTLSALAN